MSASEGGLYGITPCSAKVPVFPEPHPSQIRSPNLQEFHDLELTILVYRRQPY